MDENLGEYRNKPIVGIDLGTTKSAVAFRPEGGKAKLLKDDDGYKLTPSCVGWNRAQQEWVVGRAAKELAETDPGAVAYSIKRYIGRRFLDPEVQSSYRDLTYQLEQSSGDVQLEDIVAVLGMDQKGRSVRLSAPAVSSKVLEKLRLDAGKRLGVDGFVEDQTVQYAVVTVPARFNVLQRRATILAGKKAGLVVVDILNEPTAAALAYKDQLLEKDRERRILVYDLGGGTFDISLLEVSLDENGYLFFTRLVDGDTRLGGDDIDLSVMRWLNGELERKYGYKVRSEDLATMERLRHEAEEAKKILSRTQEVTIRLANLDLGSRAPFDAEILLTQSQLEACAAETIERAARITRRAVQEIAGLGWNAIDDVILVGGQTLMPAIQRSVAQLAGRAPLVLDEPAEAVALGAAEYAHIISMGQAKFEQSTLINVVALPLGIRIPKDTQTFRPMVSANSQVPYPSKPWFITTAEDNQKEILVEVLQGRTRDATSAEECVVLGTLRMDVQEAPARTMKFKVELDVKSDGTMTLVVADLRTGNRQTKDIIETNITVWQSQPKEAQEE